MPDIIGKRRWFFVLSGVIILAGLVFLAVGGLKLGIEFSSGSMMRVSFEHEVDQGQLREQLASLGYGGAIVQHTVGGDFYIRTAGLSGEEKTRLENSLQEKFGSLKET